MPSSWLIGPPLRRRWRPGWQTGAPQSTPRAKPRPPRRRPRPRTAGARRQVGQVPGSATLSGRACRSLMRKGVRLGPAAGGGGARGAPAEASEFRRRGVGGVTKPSAGGADRAARTRLEALLLDLLEQRGAVQAQELRRTVLVPVRLLERLEDQVGLEVLDHVAEGEARGRQLRGRRGRCARAAQRGGQVVDRDRALAAEHDEALDRVLELAHVAGPGVREQALLGLLGELGRPPALAARRLEEV